MLDTARERTVIRVDGGDGGWDRRPLADEVDADLWEPGRWLVLAMLVIAGAAGSLAVLPAAIGLGLLRAPAGELAIGLGGLAAFVGGVLGGVKWVAAAWAVGHRLLTRHPASVIAAYPD